MNDEIATLIYGAIGGGIVAVASRVLENYFIAPRLTESVESRKKLFLYGRPLWRSSHDLLYRLFYIKQKMKSGPRTTLAASPKDAQSLIWFTTKEGNYISSTAYLIAAVAAWIILYERDTVFLQFSKQSLTAQFLLKIDNFKLSISNGSILWFNYINGIGEQLILKEENKPITFSSFCRNLLKDKDFLDYYSQLFQFLHEVNQGNYEKNIEDTFNSLNEIKKFLVSNNIVVETSREFEPD